MRSVLCRRVLRADPLLSVQEKLEAARAMQRAIIVASNSTAGIAAVAANFEKLQVRLGTQTYGSTPRPNARTGNGRSSCARYTSSQCSNPPGGGALLPSVKPNLPHNQGAIML